MTNTPHRWIGVSNRHRRGFALASEVVPEVADTYPYLTTVPPRGTVLHRFIPEGMGFRGQGGRGVGVPGFRVLEVCIGSRRKVWDYFLIGDGGGDGDGGDGDGDGDGDGGGDQGGVSNSWSLSVP